MKKFGMSFHVLSVKDFRQVMLIMKLSIIFLTISLQVCAAGSAQTTITLSMKNAPLEKIFKAIEQKTDFRFVYSNEIVPNQFPVNINVKEATIQQVMAVLLKNLPLHYKLIDDKTVVLVKSIATGKKEDAGILNEQLPADPIKGNVRDREGKPMSGVSVKVKESNSGTQTDADGNFSIEANNGDVLLFSYVGYADKEITVTTNNISVSLAVNIKPLDEVVIGSNVIATKRKSEVAALTVIDSKTIQNSPYQTIDQLFRGNSPSTNSIDLGPNNINSFVFSIRGANGVNLMPIKVYLDGVEVAGGTQFLNNIDKNSIDRIEIVRGPSAATLYGSGANAGIIQIFSKKGKKGTSRLNVSTAFGTIKSDFVNKNPLQQNHSIEYMAGGDNFSMNVGANYINHEPFFPEADKKAGNAYAGFNANLDKVNIGFTLRYSNQLVGTQRIFVFDKETNPFFKMPGFQLSQNKNQKNISQTIGTNIQYKAFSWWTHNLIAGFDQSSYSSYDTKPNAANSFSISEQQTFIPSIRYNNSLLFGKDVSKLKATLTTGIEYSDEGLNTVSYSSPQRFGNANATNTFTIRSKQENKGYFAQFAPSLNDQYFLVLGIRFEDNDFFGSDFGIATLPRVGITANYQVGNIAIKPRFAYGVGITAPSRSDVFGSPDTTFSVQIANPFIKPNKQTGWDGGVDIYAFNNKLHLEAGYYSSDLEDMIWKRQTGRTSSGKSILQAYNVGLVENTGWEFAAEWNAYPLTMKGTYTSSKSLVKKAGDDLDPSGIIKVGRKMPGIPYELAGLNLTYSLNHLFKKVRGGSISLGFDHRDKYSYIDVYNFYITTFNAFTGMPPSDPAALTEGYWLIDYPSLTRWNFAADLQLSKIFSTFLQVRNLFDNTDPDGANIFPTQGRGWLLGLKASVSK